ncbi:MAG: urate hydroxylase PuuD [Burkholderiaceae bacterium]|jgi:uncharacterized membrane protein
MSSILQSLQKTIVAGVVLLLVILAVVASVTGSAVNLSSTEWWRFLFRYFHVLAGVMWIGLLWYFNFVQTPSMPKIPDAEKPAVSKVIAPTALFWFRHAALWTVITGAIVAALGGYLVPALTLTQGVHTIGIGMWLALVMAYNVWFIIWPNQKKALGIVVVEADEKAKAAKTAGMTSRINTLLSVPMLFCMVAQQNGGL